MLPINITRTSLSGLHRSSMGGKVRVDDSSASKKPEATGGKTGKGDWNAAKSSPVPSAGGKIRRSEAEAASRQGPTFLEHLGMMTRGCRIHSVSLLTNVNVFNNCSNKAQLM